MSKIALLTTFFPYNGGEQFIEDEIKYWGEVQEKCELVIIPRHTSKSIRQVPNGVSVASPITRSNNVFFKLFCIFKSIFSFALLHDYVSCYRLKRLNFSSFVYILRVHASFWLSVAALKKSLGKERYDVGYCYWNDIDSYAMSYLKNKGYFEKIHVRCHRFDIYEDETQYEYWPLKRYYSKSIDTYHVICDSACEYLNNTYGVDIDRIDVSRLGVKVPNDFLSCYNSNEFHLLSLSNCVDVKRIDKIIDALSLVDDALSLNIVWTHIGDGPKFESLVKRAEAKLTNKVKFRFIGSLHHTDVIQYFYSEQVDVFVNTSQSEGVPVSIMEAMAFGVPVIAPDVGGVAEVLELQSCVLMGNSPSSRDVYEAIIEVYPKAMQYESRLQCKGKIEKEYNSDTNYRQFIEKLL